MINIFFKNSYVLMAGGASLITSTCFWFFAGDKGSQPTKSISPQPDASSDTNPKVTSQAKEPQADGSNNPPKTQNSDGGAQTPAKDSGGQAGKVQGTVTQVTVNLPAGNGSIDTSGVMKHLGNGGSGIKA